MIVGFDLNGEPRSADVEGWESLLWVLREQMGLPGSKPACEQGECGACSVIVDGDLVCACLVMIADIEGARVTSVEGLGSELDPHPVAAALVEHGGVQCGFCTPGIVVALAHLLETSSDPSDEDVREALSGNLCRCTGYGAILRAVRALGEQAP
ncbi:MAG: (2Fe-2S)-binding protein [Acidimicrobiia bacterium]